VIVVRAARPEDQAALRALDEASPDGGTVTFRPELHVPEDQVTRLADIAEHYVAEVDGVVAGTARLDIGTCRFEGTDVRYALLNSLQVHPDYRRRGVAAELARSRLARAEELEGGDVVALAYIQAGNAGSLANARRWATQVGGRLVVAPIGVRRRPPRTAGKTAGLTVRPAGPGELGPVAVAVNADQAGHDFARPWPAGRLAQWLADSPFPEPVNHYQVAVDQSGQLLAGLGIREEGRIASLVVERIPLPMRAANAVLRVVPRDGRMRNLVVSRLWFAPGRLDAARYLWEMTRWQWRDAGTSLVVAYDPRSPVRQVVAAPPWVPMTSTTIALRSRRPMHPETILEML
jgi:predicted N-acetyltransferase YhbS